MPGNPITFADIESNLIAAAHELLHDNQERFENLRLYNWQNNIFRIKPTSNWANEIVSMTSTRMWPEYQETAPIPRTSWNDTDMTIMELSEFALGFDITRRYLMYGDPKTAVIHVMPRLADWMEDFVKRGLLRHSQLASVVFTDAFLGNIYTGLDGEPLCSIHHTTTIPGNPPFVNLIHNDLDAAGLTAAYDLFFTWYDAENIPLAEQPDTLLVPPRLERQARQLVFNDVLPGGTNDEYNPWRGVITSVEVCDWLRDHVVAGADEWWFLLSSQTHTLKGFIGEEPHILPKFDYPNQLTATVTGITSGVYGWHDWRGIVGSDGSQT